MNEIAVVLEGARAALGGVPREPLGVLRVPRRVLGIARAPRIEPAGSAWHLGVLLLTDDALLATGEVVRAREAARRGFAAESQRRRAELAEAAFRGGFPEGAVAHVGWTPIDLDALARGEESGPVAPAPGGALLRWSRAGARMPLAAYVAERIDLLTAPPQGAT